MKRLTRSEVKTSYDLAVIGGGITGAAIAYEGALRGLKVALLERSDFGGATSAATGKLIHGGLRYLKNGEFGVVRESLRERAILSNIAPNFVCPQPFLLRNPSAIARVGLGLYGCLSAGTAPARHPGKVIPSHRMLSAAEVLELEPRLPAEGLSGAALYYDCLSLAPERLTLSFVKSAAAAGADVANYAEVVRLRTHGGKVLGVDVRDMETGATYSIDSRATINAAGPWAGELLRGAASVSAPPQKHSEGIFVITRSLTDRYQVVYAGKRGHFSLAPWRGHTLIGPTEKAYFGSPSDWRVTRESIEELLATVNSAWGGTPALIYDDVVHAYGGLRPLLEAGGKDTYGVSRRSELRHHAQEGLACLFTACGAKYTTSRALAEKTVDRVSKITGLRVGKSETAERALVGCDVSDVESQVLASANAHPWLSSAAVDYLARHYGSELDSMLHWAQGRPHLGQPLNRDGEILAQVVHAVESEMALHLTDVLLRRTGLGTLGHPGKDVLHRVAEVMGSELQWGEAVRAKELATAEQALTLPGHGRQGATG